MAVINKTISHNGQLLKNPNSKFQNPTAVPWNLEFFFLEVTYLNVNREILPFPPAYATLSFKNRSV